MTTEKRLEIEVKIRVQHLDALRRKIRLLPADLETARAFERNMVFDTAGGHLKGQGILLRLRQQGARVLLTMKSPLQGQTAYKVREETEVDVSDFEKLKKIFAAIGFQVCFVYEKYREVYRALGAQIMVDETPIGNFIEIEGDPDRIDAVAARLGFAASDYIADSYYRLFLVSGRSGHMVFTP